MKEISIFAMALLDILIVIAVLVIVASRFLGFKLPTDTRDKATRNAELKKLFPPLVPPKERPSTREETADVEAAPAAVRARPNSLAKGADGKPLNGMAHITAIDNQFNEAKFLSGTRNAYSYFYQCWNGRDEVGMDNLCGPTLLQKITQTWAAEPTTIHLESEVEASILSARVSGRTAIINVRMSALQREENAPPRTVVATWIFARALNAPDPNWELQDILPQADA